MKGLFFGLELLLFSGLCAAGWFLFLKLKIPTPAILGPLAAVCVANVLGWPAAPPAWLKPVLSVIMGIMLGLRFNLRLKGLWKQVLLASVWIMGISVLAAKTLAAVGLNEATALFAAMPGGIAEISLMALDYHADGFAVALLQTSRLLLTMLLIPILARRAPKPAYADAEKQAARKPQYTDWAILLALGGVAAFLFSGLHVPAGTMVGPMLAVGLYIKVRGIGARPNKTLQSVVQMGVGGLVGLGITKESLLRIDEYFLPALLLCVLVVGGSLLLSLALNKISGWDKRTCLLAASPAGLSPTVLLAMELEADSAKVIVFQVLRLGLVLLFAPLCAGLMLG